MRPRERENDSTINWFLIPTFCISLFSSESSSSLLFIPSLARQQKWVSIQCFCLLVRGDRASLAQKAAADIFITRILIESDWGSTISPRPVHYQNSRLAGRAIVYRTRPGRIRSRKKLIVLCMGNWNQKKTYKHERRSNGIHWKFSRSSDWKLKLKFN